MPEAITKFAINSTLGADDFRPLDQIIIGQKQFVASDTVLMDFGTNVDRITNTVDFGDFTPKLSGTVKIKSKVTQTHFSAEPPTIIVYSNGSVIKQFTLPNRSATSDEEIYAYFGEFFLNVVKGNTYKISAKRNGSYSVSVDYVNLCAEVVDSFWYDFNLYE